MRSLAGWISRGDFGDDLGDIKATFWARLFFAETEDGGEVGFGVGVGCGLDGGEGGGGGGGSGGSGGWSGGDVGCGGIDGGFADGDGGRIWGGGGGARAADVVTLFVCAEESGDGSRSVVEFHCGWFGHKLQGATSSARTVLCCNCW